VKNRIFVVIILLIIVFLAGFVPQYIKETEINEADIQLTNALYPVAQDAMRRGYYMPNRASIDCSRHQCPHWRRCEQDFGGVVEP
jgi:uncharacterized membrane-anchored protein